MPAQDSREVILDVREDEEFDAESIAGSVHLPLSSFPRRAPGVLQALAGKKLVLMCRSGRRAELAKDEIARLGFPDVESEVYGMAKLLSLMSWNRAAASCARGGGPSSEAGRQG